MMTGRIAVGLLRGLLLRGLLRGLEARRNTDFLAVTKSLNYTIYSLKSNFIMTSHVCRSANQSVGRSVSWTVG